MPKDFILSRAERYILANQYRILALLEPEREAEYARQREALEHGYFTEYAPAWITRDEDTLTREDVDLVQGIMAMFSDLGYFYEKLGKPSGIEERDVRFIGFDGNNECGYMAFARYLVEDGHSWERLVPENRTDLFNSHMPTLWRYRPMLAAYRRVRDLPPKHELTVDQLVEVVAAGRGVEGGDPTR